MLQFFLGGLRGGDEQTQAKPASRRAFLRVEGLEDRCTPAFFTVNTVLDTPDSKVGDGAAQDENGKTSLRAAVEEGNAAAGPHTIGFDLSPEEGNIIWLGSGLVLTKSYTIDGSGNFGQIGDDPIGVSSYDTTREGGGGEPGGGVEFPEGVSIRRILSNPLLPPVANTDTPFRLITVEEGGVGVTNSLTVRRLDLRYGYAVGNTVDLQSGGAIYSPQQLTIEMSSFSGNTADASGGAVRANGVLSISNSAFVGNAAFFNGGALDFTAPLGLAPQVISGSVFRDNIASKDGGAIHSGVKIIGVLPPVPPPATLFALAGTIVEGNFANRGGGIASGGSIWVDGGSVSYNNSTKEGGGFFYSSTTGSALFSGLRLDGNQAGTAANPENGGGVYVNSGDFTLDTPFSFTGNLGTNGTQGGAFRNGLATFATNGLPANADSVNGV